MTPTRLVPLLVLAALLSTAPAALAGASAAATDGLCRDLAPDPCAEPRADCAATPGGGSHAAASCAVAAPGAALACDASVSTDPALRQGCVAAASTGALPTPCDPAVAACPEPCVGEPVGCVEIPDFPVSETICTPVSGFLVMCYDIVCMYFQQPPWWLCYVTAPYEAWIG